MNPRRVPSTVVAVDATGPAGDAPLGTRLLAAADSTPGGVVVLGPAGPTDRLIELLTGPYGIGAVVPAAPSCHGRQRGAHDVGPEQGESAGAVAVRAGLVARAGIDPGDRDAAHVARILLAAAHSEGRRIAADPLWPAVDADPGPPSASSTPRLPRGAALPGEEPGSADPAVTTAGDGVRILVVTAPLHSERMRMEDRAAARLISSLSRLAGPSRVTVMSTERVPEAQRLRWAAAGLDVVQGPESWSDGPGGHGDLYSHVVVTSEAARSPVRAWIDATQPHAGRVVHFPSLDFRDLTRVAPIGVPEELEGLRLARLYAEDAVAHLAHWAHVVWCEWAEDASVLRAAAPEVPVVVVPPVLESRRPAVRLEQRRGLLLVAGEPHDVVAGNEDAAMRSLEEVLGQIRRRDPSVGCTVVVDRPSPMLTARCRESGAAIVPEAALDEELARARVLLAAHGYGSGQPAVLMDAIEAGLPFVCTPWAAGDMDLGSVAGVAVCGRDEDLATRTWQLLHDDRRWHAVSAEAGRLAAERYRAKRHDEALAGALAMIGVTPVDGPPEWPEVGPPPLPPVPFVNPRLATRPEGTPEPEPLRGDPPGDERSRYQLWHRRRGPTPGVLEAIRRDLDGLSHRPVISILMPVYNTGQGVLAAAVESVRNQIYERWQLCVCNDGSDRPETLEYLDRLRGSDERIVVVDGDGPSGIAAATNSALAAATGDYVAFLDHDDELKPHALAQVARWLDADPTTDVVYTDEDKLDPDGRLYDPHIKPDWSPDQLTAQNYVCHLTVGRRSLVEEVGGLRPDFDGSQDYDLILRLTERTDRVAHIPEPLYSWRAVPGSAAAVADAKPYAIEAARRAVADALERRGYGGRVDTTSRPGFFRPRYPIPGQPKVSIIVPTRNGRHLLERCLGSVLERSTYRNYEIVIIDNNTTEGPTLEYLANGPWRVLRYPHPFNYARMMNLGARAVECDALLFLNNDTEVITPEWIEGLLEHAMRPEVGAVGARLFFGDGTAQHEGIMTGIGGWAHSANRSDYWARGELTRNVSAVTGACTMVRPSVWRRVGGNDERLRVAYNDVDVCLRMRQAGYQIVYTPYVELYHYESSSRGRFEHMDDGPIYGQRWRVKDHPDAYYSPMFEDYPPFLLRV